MRLLLTVCLLILLAACGNKSEARWATLPLDTASSASHESTDTFVVASNEPGPRRTDFVKVGDGKGNYFDIAVPDSLGKTLKYGDVVAVKTTIRPGEEPARRIVSAVQLQAKK